MVDVSALKVAIDLMHVPSRVRLVKAAPLPDGMALLLQIAAEEDAALTQGAELSGRSRDVVKSAAAFFVEQILLDADADSYRVLGAHETATNAELRRNMALLLKALHPDLDQNKDRSVFAGRVTGAWENLKSQDRRDVYDRMLQARQAADVGEQRGQSGRASRLKLKNRLRQAGVVQFSGNTHVSQKRHTIGKGQTGFIRRALSFILGSDNN